MFLVGIEAINGSFRLLPFCGVLSCFLLTGLVVKSHFFNTLFMSSLAQRQNIIHNEPFYPEITIILLIYIYDIISLMKTNYTTLACV